MMTTHAHIVVLMDSVTHQVKMIESVWSTPELARSAINYHSIVSKREPHEYQVIEREINTARHRS
jgi:hypothetical protein